jgi:hypothetical protein
MDAGIIQAIKLWFWKKMLFHKDDDVQTASQLAKQVQFLSL